MKYRSLWKNQEKLVKLFSSDICIGVDEVGRGSLAGPVVAVAVSFRSSKKLEVYDSKKISEKKRLDIFKEILKQKPLLGVGIVSQLVIDKVNILNATKLAMKKALSLCFSVLNEEINPANPLVLIDGNFILKDFTCKQIAVENGDSEIAIIAAASIIAKVIRDEIMNVLSDICPEYLLFKNKGYGTKEHLLAISNFGFSHLHRMTFRI